MPESGVPFSMHMNYEDLLRRQGDRCAICNRLRIVGRRKWDRFLIRRRPNKTSLDSAVCRGCADSLAVWLADRNKPISLRRVQDPAWTTLMLAWAARPHA